MRIILLSDTKQLEQHLKNRLISEITKRGSRIAYISSSKQPRERKWFHNTSNEYQAFHTDIQLEYFDLSEDFSDRDLKKVSTFDVMHLSGGNTYEFLNYIRSRNFQNIIYEFVNNNELIIGISAGAILLTPSIRISALLHDENTVHLTDLTGLNIVPFEFYPHYEHSKSQQEIIINYSKKTQRTVYACSNESGILVEDKKITPFGKIDIISAT